MKRAFLSAALAVAGAARGFAEPQDFATYLNAMNLTEVTFAGYIKYDDRSLNDVDFTYYDVDGKPFPVTMDAGRKTREKVQADCAFSSIMFSLKDLCRVTGTGTVEIRGSRIHLSIDRVTGLDTPG